MTVSTILRIVSAGLQDMDPDNAKRWKWEQGSGQNEIGLIDYLNSAINEIAVRRPDCYAITDVIYLQPGMKQQLPKRALHGAQKDAVLLCELIRNMGSNGRTPGSPILLSNQQVTFAWSNPRNKMSRSYPRQIDNYMYDRSTNPNIYYVFPEVPSDAATNKVYVECSYYALPPQVTSINEDLPVSVGYAQAIAHHILSSIFEVDNESIGSDKAMKKADYHYQLFEKCMSVKLEADLRIPRANNSVR